jgi:hypothetical protein
VQGPGERPVRCHGNGCMGRRVGAYLYLDAASKSANVELVSIWTIQFFLELWAEINRQASLRAIAEASPLLPHTKASQADPPESTIFEELIRQYEKLLSRSEDMIVQQVCKEIEGGLKLHFAMLTS